MKVFFDEDNGTGIPRALQLVRAPAEMVVYPSTAPGAALPKGTADLDWIRWVAANGFLAVSQNHRLVEDPLERHALTINGAGVVFIGSGRAPAWRVLELLLRRWEWLQELDLNLARPFAFRLNLDGSAEQFDFEALRWRRVPVRR